MAQGTVKWYDPDKGYGFLVPDGGASDVFVQREALRGAELLPGDRVMYALEQGPRGPIAKQVRLIQPTVVAEQASPKAAERLVVPVHEEQLSATAHEVDLGEVLLHMQTETEPVSTVIDLAHDELSIERIPINQPIDAVPDVRYEDEVIIVPVLGEEVVTAKRLVLKEEVHIRRRRVTEPTPIQETVRRQVVDIEGRPAPGVTPTVESVPNHEQAPSPADIGGPDDDH